MAMSTTDRVKALLKLKSSVSALACVQGATKLQETLMNYTVKYLKEITDVVQAGNIKDAAMLAQARAYREENTRVLSIEVIKEGVATPPKNPTPFDRPPDGTPGAGQMRIVETELMARAA